MSPTTPVRLRLADLARGLEMFGNRYHAIDVFADDLQEIQTGERVPGLVPQDAEGRNFHWSAGNGHTYELRVFPAAGVVRLARPHIPGGNPTAIGALVGAAAGTALGAAGSKKGEGAGIGLILGLLAGAAIGSGISSDPQRRIFTLRFDPSAQQWRAYDGALVPWMKAELRPEVS